MVQYTQVGTLIVSVIVASGVLGLVTPAIIIKPNIDIQAKPNEADTRLTIISITNTGNAAATHLLLTVTNKPVFMSVINWIGQNQEEARKELDIVDPRSLTITINGYEMKDKCFRCDSGDYFSLLGTRVFS